MEVVLAVIEGIVPFKAPGVWVTGFGEVGPTGLPVGAGVGVEERDVVLGRHHLLEPRAVVIEARRAVLKNVGEGLEGLRRGVGPALAAPPAAVGLENEERVMPLDGRGAEGSLEELRVAEVFPGLFKTLAARRHVKLPGDVADQLAAVGAAGEAACIVDPASGFNGNAVKRFVVAEGGNEETAPLVPQRRFHLLSQRLRGGPVGGGLGGLPEQILHSRKRLEIGPLVGDEARPIARRATEDVGRLPATDVELHPVVVPHLPIKPGRGDEVAVVPALRVCLETGKDVAREDGRRCGGRVAGGAEVESCGMDEMNAPHRVGKPGGIVARLGAGGVHPVPGVIAGDPRRPQPAGLGELVAGRAGDGAIRPRPGRPVEKLGEQIAAVRRAVGEMLGEEFKAVPPGRLDVGVGAIEEGNVVKKPRLIASVPERFPLHEHRLGSLGRRDPFAGGLGRGPERKADGEHEQQGSYQSRDRADRQRCPRRRTGLACCRGRAAGRKRTVVGKRSGTTATRADVGKEEGPDRLEETGDEERCRGIEPGAHRAGEPRTIARGQIHQRHRGGELRRGHRRRRDPHEEGEERHRHERQAGFVDSKP